MERFYSIIYFVILYSILILALEVNIMESAIIHKQKRSYQVEICSNTKSTINYDVTTCPYTRGEQLERSRILNCHMSCHRRPCVYHCVKYLDRIVEVCAPVEILRGHHCPIYDEGIGRVREDILTVCTKCPFEKYSNDTMNSECMMSTVSVAESSKENKTEVIINLNSAVTNCSQVHGRSKRHADCGESSSTATESSSSTSTRPSEDDKLLSGSQEEINPFRNQYVIAGVMMFICMVLLSVGVFLQIRSKRRSEIHKQTQKDNFFCQKKCNPGIASSQSLL